LCEQLEIGLDLAAEVRSSDLSGRDAEKRATEYRGSA
jgi:hypothetical protein